MFNTHNTFHMGVACIRRQMNIFVLNAPVNGGGGGGGGVSLCSSYEPLLSMLYSIFFFDGYTFNLINLLEYAERQNDHVSSKVVYMQNIFNIKSGSKAIHFYMDFIVDNLSRRCPACFHTITFEIITTHVDIFCGALSNYVDSITVPLRRCKIPSGISSCWKVKPRSWPPPPGLRKFSRTTTNP